ncbi:MAG TPA: hypothetical protein VI112_14580, partial [Bacteroidia bacterium]
YRSLFREILRKTRPKVVFFQGYYENDTFGLTAAAREMNITVIDIQHGKQGRFHPMYSHWTRIPRDGYELLPDFFWNWGEESKEDINRWKNNKEVHVPVVGGNLWLARWKNGSLYRASEPDKEFLDGLSKAGRVILYTLQPLDKAEVFPRHVMDAIRNSPADWVWLLRIHPFQKLDAEEVKKMFEGISSRIETKFSTSIPLYHLLQHVHHHLTLWSSTCFEANEFGVPTTIAHDFGYKLFEGYIKENVFSFATDPGEIIRMVKEHKPNRRSGFLETNPDIAREALKRMGI